MTIRSWAAFALLLLGAAGTAVTAEAQVTTPQQPPAQPQRPGQPLFGGDRRDTQSRHSLALNASIFGAYDTHIAGPQTIGTLPKPGDDQKGSYTSVDAGLFYNHRGNKVSFGASGDSTFAYYPSLHEDVGQPIDSYSAAAMLTARLGRTQFQASQSVSYQPYFVLQTLPTAPIYSLSPSSVVDTVLRPNNQIPVGVQSSILDKPGTIVASDVSYTAPLSRRAGIAFTYGHYGTDFGGTYPDISSHSAAIRVSDAVSRSTQIYGTYSYQNGAYDRAVFANTSNIAAQGMDAGVSYTRRLSSTRSLRLFGGGGGNKLNERFEADPAAASVQGTAHGGMDLQFGRSWSTHGEFSRSLQLLQGIAQPYFGNAVSGGIRGGFGRRVVLSGNGNYSQGAVGIDALSRSYDTRSAFVMLQIGLSREMALSADYSNAEYSFNRSAVLPEGVIRRLNRQTFRVGLTWVMPLLGRQSLARP